MKRRGFVAGMALLPLAARASVARQAPEFQNCRHSSAHLSHAEMRAVWRKIGASSWSAEDAAKAAVHCGTKRLEEYRARQDAGDHSCTLDFAIATCEGFAIR
jgi:hypothetical protein